MFDRIAVVVIGIALSWLAGGYADAATWTKIGVAPGAPNTWRKITTAPGAPNSWRKLGDPDAFIFNDIIAANTQEYSLHNRMIVAGWNGVVPVIVTLTVNAGVSVWSDDPAKPALDATNQGGNFAASSTITLTNQGSILGRGGNGGHQSAGQDGGPAVAVGAPLTITSSGYIAGGGGGGGAPGMTFPASYYCYPGGGGGAGGGAGGPTQKNFFGFHSAAGGTGGGLGASGSNGPVSGAYTSAGGGGGGGRVLFGTGGTGGGYQTAAKGGGTGGGGGFCNPIGFLYLSATGGSGSSPGNDATASPLPQPGVARGGGGGGWGAAGGKGWVIDNSKVHHWASGGAGGMAIKLNGNSITWTAGAAPNTIYGAVN